MSSEERATAVDIRIFSIHYKFEFIAGHLVGISRTSAK
jgi:hypothetical protein